MSHGRHRQFLRADAAHIHPMGVAALVVTVLVVVTVSVPLATRLFGCSEAQYLRVAAAISVAPVLQEAASEFNSEAESCLYIQVTELAPHLVMTELAGGRTLDSTIAPEVWVPESSAWVELARISEAGAQTIEPAPQSLASSPVVLAAPEGAEGIPGDDADPTASWDLVLPGERDPHRPLVMVDPNRGADGMATMYAVRQLLGTGDEADTAMTEFVRDVQLDSAFGHIELTGVYPGAEPLTVVPEQSVWLYNSRSPETRLRARYPEEGTVSLDYPFATATEDPDMRAAAEELYELVTSSAYRQRFQELGFRDPDGQAARSVAEMPGIEAEVPLTHDELTGDALLTAVEDWNRLSMPSRALVLADVSDTAAEDLNGGPPRLEVTRDAALLGLDLFPDQTDMGLWLLSTELDDSGREEMRDLARLDEQANGRTVRDELREIAEDIGLEGGQSRLYDGIASAYEEMTESYHEDKINSVILLTAGDDDGHSDISHSELVAQLEDSFDPERPVTMFIIAFGDLDDETPLTEIARATSGTAYFTDDAGEIGDIFLSSISRRLCVPNCDNREDSP